MHYKQFYYRNTLEITKKEIARNQIHSWQKMALKNII